MHYICLADYSNYNFFCFSFTLNLTVAAALPQVDQFQWNFMGNTRSSDDCQFYRTVTCLIYFKLFMLLRYGISWIRLQLPQEISTGVRKFNFEAP